MVVCRVEELRMEKQLPGAGMSSFDLIHVQILFERLCLAKGSTFVDLGCGRGEYAIEAALRIGEKGIAYAIDLWEDGLVVLATEAEFRDLPQLRVVAADICSTLPVDGASIDVCFAAVVFHDLVQEGCAESMLEEAHRILKPHGRLAILEFKKFDGHPGPPISVKLSPDQVEQIVAPHGFARNEVTEVGPYNYLITFESVFHAAAND